MLGFRDLDELARDAAAFSRLAAVQQLLSGLAFATNSTVLSNFSFAW